MTSMLDTGTVLSSCEDRCFAVPKGQARTAQRFNAGLHAKRSRVPKGRLRSNPTPNPSAVPSGLVCPAGCFPALKRRAILKMSLRDKRTWLPPFPPSEQPDSLAMPSRAIRGYGVQPGSCGKRSSAWEMVRGRGIRLPCRATIRTVPASVERCGTPGSVVDFSH
jgi:hypothetical protein